MSEEASRCDEELLCANNNSNEEENDGLIKANGEEEFYKQSRSLASLFRSHAHTVLTVVLAIALSMTLTRSNSWKESQSSLSLNSGKTPFAPLPDSSQAVDTIAFGSCMKQNMPQPFWDTVVKADPQVTVLMGDQVYPNGDCKDDACTNLRESYEILEQHPSFQGAKAMLPMVAILDDHDYGQNDCYEKNPYKDVAKELFFEFYQIPETDERRAPDRATEGLYTSYEWGPMGQRTQLIVLDTRYSRSKFKYSAKEWAYLPDHDNKHKRMLSHAQWEWLEHDVLQRPANVRLIVSSVQVLTEGEWGFEHWSLIPHELGKLKKMLQKYCHNVENPSLPVLLSGDRHIGAFYYDEEHDINEVTASSWTHTIPHGYDPDGVKCATEAECIEADPVRVGEWVSENHFGLVNMDWEQRSVEVSLVQSDTSHGFPVKTKWARDTDAGKKLKTIVLQIP